MSSSHIQLVLPFGTRQHRAMVRFFVRIALSLVVLLCQGFSLSAAPPTKAGTYHDWDGTIDSLTILRPFKLASYKRIIVLPLDTTKVVRPPSDKNTFRAVEDVLAHSTDKFKEGIQRDLKNKAIPVHPAGNVAESLVIRGRILVMDPGSQAARSWIGFGAGAARVQIEGELVDGRSSLVLANFKQERRSGVGLLGGGYHAVLDRSLREIGEDVASILNAM